MATSMLALKFRIFKGNELVGFRELNQGVIKIGKVPSAHICLDDESVSRMHAIVEIQHDTAYLIDLGSTRGTFINGQRINKAKLANGDAIQIGNVRLELALTTASSASSVAASAAPVATPPPPPVAALRTAPPAPLLTLTPAPLPMLAPAMLAAAPLSPVAFGAAMADDEPGARAVEVAAMLGDSVVDVKHCMDPRGGKVTARTWGFLAGGLACLLTSATAFYVSVDNAATNRAALEYHTRVLHKPAYSYRPKTVGVGVDWAAFGGLALGLLGMTAGLARARGEKQSPYYRIGTAPGVEQAVEQAPSACFPLVAPSGDDFVFNYGAGMDGEMIVDGKSTPLSELAASGRSRPSLTTAGAIEVPIPAFAKIRARAGQTTFMVSAVAKPRQQAMPLFGNLERRTVAYVAGSLVLHLGIVAFLQTVPVEDGTVNIDLAMVETTAIDTSNTAKEDVPDEVVEDASDGLSGDPAAGGKMALEEGASGKPDAKQEQGHIRIKDNQTSPQLSRAEAIQAATEAGFLGSASVISGGINSITGTADLSSGFDTMDVYGPLIGSEGEGRGNFGFGRSGFGPGGGCLGGDCGIVGTGRYGTLGNGDKVGDGWGGGGNGNGRFRKRDGLVPSTTIGMPRPTDGLDKAIIRRYVKRNLARISYCYEAELLAKPSLEGTVSVQFLITASGSVSDANGNGVDGKVSSCVANVIKNIEFPRPTNGGSVQVNYPFTFRAAGR